MFLATINRPRNLLYICYAGHVKLKDLQSAAPEIKVLLGELKPGLNLLADLSQVEVIDFDCVPEIGKTMELLEPYNLGLVVRVIPDPDKDIGFNIISAFHYKRRPQTVTCETLQQAAKLLSL